MTVTTNAGNMIKIGAAPAGLTVSDFDNVTTTEIGWMRSLSGLGKAYNTSDFLPMSSRRVITLKTSYTNQVLTIGVGIVNADAGQTQVKTALDSDASYTFAIIYQAGDKIYFTGQVTGFTEDGGDANGFRTGTITVSPTSDLYAA